MSTDTNHSEHIRLSVIVPTYNCRDYLDECMQSILGQLPSDCELIIADDGSDDGTAELLGGYEAANQNVHTVYREHKGASSARNAGLDTASGKFVTFIDCDDCLRDGFLRDSLPLIDDGTDMYIFGIERIPLSGSREYWTVSDRVYPDASAFADEYIRKRKLMIYSNCNKFYRRSVIEQHRLRFDEAVGFGEDRLFNYQYLSVCGGRIVTSAIIMLCYIQRSTHSMSSKHIPEYFSCVLRLHREKMKCFLSLSKSVSEEEKRDFIAFDISREIEKTLDRFETHPEEKEENLPMINRLIFGEIDDSGEPLDIIAVLGSTFCRYRIQKAWEIGKQCQGTLYIVSGGSPCAYGSMTEAEYMASWLTEHGVSASDIYVENRATCTQQNLEYIAGIIHAIRSETGKPLSKIGILTGGFHVSRTRMLAEGIPALAGENLLWLPAYSPITHPDVWWSVPRGRKIILEELRKNLIYETPELREILTAAR